MPDPKKLARAVETDLKRLGDPTRAVGEKAYLKSDLDFFGTRLTDIRSVTRSVAGRAEPNHDELIAIAQALWDKRIFERRMAAVVLLENSVVKLDGHDLPVIETFIRESKTWALVDGLAVNVVGGIALRRKIKQKLDRWARDEDFWIRRSSLLAELKPLKQGAPLEPFAARADAMLEEKEFFIRKAIGWVLRETSKKRPDEVYRWLAPRAHRASGVTMREAVKYLGPEREARLMAKYKARSDERSQGRSSRV